MSNNVTIKQDPAADWTSRNPTLAQFEIGLETDTGKAKLGDGLTAWTNLGYWSPSGSGGGNAGDYALEFTSANQSHVNHGLFWVPGTAYGNFFCEALIKPTSDGYVVSAGYGGAHCLLLGVTGDASSGYLITGNVHDSDAPLSTSFGSLDRLRHNEWAHIGVAYDGTWITTIINGVPSNIVAYAGQRKTANAYEGVMFIGGSDHQNFGGSIAVVRLFEGNVPYANLQNAAVRPAIDRMAGSSVYKGAAPVAVNFLADYRNGTTSDLSSGLSNVLHNGYLAEASQAITGEEGVYAAPLLYDRTPGLYPQWVNDPFAWSTASAAAKTPIASSVIYDGFGKPDVHYGNAGSLSLGTTEVGSKTWTATGYGILNGNVFAASTSPGAARVSDTATDGTVILKKPSTSFPAGVGAAYRLLFRYTDSSNYNFLYVDEYGQGIIFTVVAGVQTNTGTFTFGTGWTEARVTCSGNTVTTLNGATQKDSKTVAANNTGTGKGFELNHPLLRVSEFAVL